jgi:16S rRNA (guanine966-N2)-methyltransferase
MRIIGGSRRGRRLVEWEGSEIRPVRDFVRSAVFSILLDFVPDATCLDLYAGTGSLGLEALSRGARRSTFVDRSHEACGIIRRNLDSLQFLDAGEVIEAAALDAIDLFGRRGRRFDVIFLDPPYAEGLVPPTLEALADGRILADDPVVIAAMHRTEATSSAHGVLRLVDQRRYGDNRVFFYRRHDEDRVDREAGND